MVVDYSQERPREAATAAEITDSRSTPGYRRGGLGGRRGSSRKIVFGVQKQKENSSSTAKKEGDADTNDTNDLLSLCTSLPASTKKDAATPSPSSNKPRPHMMGRRSASFKFGVPDNRFGFEELKKSLSQQNLMDDDDEDEKKTTTLAFPKETQQRRSTMPLSFFSSSDHDAKSTAAVAETITPPNVRHERGGNALQSLHQLCGSRRSLAERQATATTEPMSGESEEDSDYNPEDEDEEDEDDSVSVYSTSTYGYDDSDLDLKYDHDDDDDDDNDGSKPLKPVKLRPPKTPIPKAPIVPTRIQVIPASPDETDLGYGDATPEPDLGYGDAAPSKEPDLGYGDATPQQQKQKQQPQQPSPKGRGSMGFMPGQKNAFNPRSYFATRRENSRRGSMNTGLARFPHHNHRRCTMQHLTIRETSGHNNNTHTEPQITADFQLPTRRRSNSMNMLGGGGNNTEHATSTEKRLSMGGKSERVIPSSQTNGVASQLSFRRRGSNQSMGSRRNSMDDSQYQEPTAFVTRSTIRRIDNTSEQIDLVGGRRTAVLAGPNPVV